MATLWGALPFILAIRGPTPGYTTLARHRRRLAYVHLSRSLVDVLSVVLGVMVMVTGWRSQRLIADILGEFKNKAGWFDDVYVSWFMW